MQNSPPFRPGTVACLMRLGDTEKAKIAFKTELASNANDFESNLYLGVLLRQDKQMDEARTHLQRAIQLRPREQYARYHLAAVYAAAGNRVMLCRCSKAC